jgi:glycosyltransferase involved in cell wall biosynthesis
MFFGTIPIVTKISCVPFILDFGKRGILIEPNITDAVESICKHIQNANDLNVMSNLASNWSQNFTLETFEAEIAKLLYK